MPGPVRTRPSGSTVVLAVLDVGHGLMANMWTFNGTVPGPQFRLTVGQTVIVHFTNLLPAGTARITERS